VDQHDESTPEDAAQTGRDTVTPRFATPPRPDTDPLVRVSPTVPRSQPTNRGRFSVWEGVIGAVVAGPSALAVVGLNSTLTGDEGDAGPGFLMVSIAFFSTLAVAILAILAIKDGIAALRPDGNNQIPPVSLPDAEPASIRGSREAAEDLGERSAEAFWNRVLFGQLTPRRRLSELVTEQRLQLHLRMDRLASRTSELRPGDRLVSIAHASRGGMKNPRVRLEPRGHDLPYPDSLARSAMR
jgi:hypothetical protein